MATRVVAIIEQSMQIELPLRFLFLEPTIKELALRVEEIRLQNEDQELISDLAEERDKSGVKYEDITI